MILLYDTSVLVAALVEAHPFHQAALPWLRRAHAREVQAAVAAHALAETFSVLTTLPHRPRITPEAARTTIRTSVLPAVRVVPLGKRDYVAVIDTLARAKLAGGIIYDALAARAAAKIKADVLTLNARDFARLAGPFAVKVVSP